MHGVGGSPTRERKAAKAAHVPMPSSMSCLAMPGGWAFGLGVSSLLFLAAAAGLDGRAPGPRRLPRHRRGCEPGCGLGKMWVWVWTG
ncbi:hypothetical protein LZ31DRAFT_161997 [Colletotrichum somersetense]|nr:hypothetical protein LZ31DRAFT_161997 [Colletotrichum somersetense]